MVHPSTKPRAVYDIRHGTSIITSVPNSTLKPASSSEAYRDFTSIVQKVKLFAYRPSGHPNSSLIKHNCRQSSSRRLYLGFEWVEAKWIGISSSARWRLNKSKYEVIIKNTKISKLIKNLTKVPKEFKETSRAKFKDC